MAYTQVTARVYDDGTETIWTTDFRSEHLGRTPTCDVDRVYLARFELEETASTSPAFKLERQLNAGSWADVTTSSTVVKSIRSHQFEVPDAEVTTNRATGSALGFVAGELNYDGAAAAVALNNQHTEHVFGFYIVSGDVADADTVRLRCYVSTSGDLDTYTETIEITTEKDLTLPGLIATARGATHVETYSYVGPVFDSNGAMYVFGEANMDYADGSGREGYNIHAWKSVNGGISWLPVGAHPTGSQFNDNESLSIVRGDPDTLGEYWLFQCHNADLNYIIWRASDHATNPDTWDNTSAGTQTGTAAVAQYWVAGVEKSDGDLWGFYGNTISTDERIVYRRQIGGSWQAQATLSSATGVNLTNGKASLGASDRVVVVFHDQTNADIYTRQVEDDNTLLPSAGDDQVNLNSTTVFVNDAPIIDVLCYDLTNDYHLTIWMDSSSNLQSNTIKWNGTDYDVGATPQQANTTTVKQDYPNIWDHEAVMAAMAVDETTGTIYVAYFGTDDDLYYNSWTEAGGWGTESSALWTSPGVADMPAYVSAQVGSHTGGKVFGMAFKRVDSTGGETSSVEGAWAYEEIDITTVHQLAVTMSQAATMKAHTTTGLVFRPDGDLLATGWDTAPTASQNLYAQIDEGVPNPTDYIYPTG